MRQHAQVVKSLASPGGNATGVNFFIAELAAKQLGLLREMAPGMALRSCKATAELYTHVFRACGRRLHAAVEAPAQAASIASWIILTSFLCFVGLCRNRPHAH